MIKETKRTLTTSYNQSGFLMTLLMSFMLTLAGCQTSVRSSAVVGPAVGPSLGQQSLPQQSSNSPSHPTIFLDVAVPVFNPGIPKDPKKLAKESIWPQLRRAEANRFALETKRALGKLAVFGDVSVVPSAKVTADLFVLGKIQKSDSQIVKIEIDVVDISGRKWGTKSFSHEVSKGFYRDKRNNGKDSYQPVFDKIASYVKKLLEKKSDKTKTHIKQVANMRFASNFSPETYSKYLKVNRRGQFTLEGLPDDNDPMSKRIALVRQQDQQFIERMQLQYEAFSAKTDDSYYTWQEKTLSIQLAAEKSERKALFGKIMGGLAIIAGAVASKNHSSVGRQVLTTGAIVGGAFLINDGLGNSREAKVQRATIDEMGESLDIEMDPQVMSLEQKTVKLTGTANDQYMQWRAHLKKIFNLESSTQRTPEEPEPK